MREFSKHLINQNNKLKEGLERLNHLGEDLTLFIVDDDQQLVGTLTDGDIRRAILQGAYLETELKGIMHTNFKSIKEEEVSIQVLKTMKSQSIDLLPVLNEKNQICEIINLVTTKSRLPIEVVIMAGGVGKRLLPLTEKVPKPLLKIGDKPIIERNVDRLIDFGVKSFHISIKYLGDQIKSYFSNGHSKGVNIQYLEETKSLGTIGAVSMVEAFDQKDILVMNSDLLTNIDYEDFYLDFKQKDADVAIAAIPYNVKVPYAVLETVDGCVQSFKEKPSYVYNSNAGIYLFKKEVFDHIPEDEFYDATDLLEKMIALNKKVITYPLIDYWLDIGRHEDYTKAQQDVKHIKW